MLEEGNTNDLMQEHEFKRSVPDDEQESYATARTINDNLMKDDLMAIASPARYREKRSKHSKKMPKKSPAENETSKPNTKDELMNILGTIRAAKHHRLSRKDIRKLARKAFAKLKMKKKDKDTTGKTTVSKSKETHGKPGQKEQVDTSKGKEGTSKEASLKADTSKSKEETSIDDSFKADTSKSKEDTSIDDSFKADTSKSKEDTSIDDSFKADTSKSKEDTSIDDSFKADTSKSKEDTSIDDSFKADTSKSKEETSKEDSFKADTSTKNTKSAKEDEQAFANMFEEQEKPKLSEFTEDISNLGDANKMSELISDDSMSTKDLGEAKKKTGTPTSSPNAAKTTAKVLKQLTHELEAKKDTKTKKSKISKKSDIPNADQTEKIKTLKTLLAKANKNKVPKKFLGQFPAGLRMIAWRELLEKKKKELGELQSAEGKEEVHKKEEKEVTPSNHPVTIDINIDPTSDKVAQVSTSDTETSAKTTDKKASKGSDEHHLASHMKYLQKHLSGVQDLRKLISRALIGHCHTTGKRILKAFVAMDRALTRAQNIATVIGKKFKVDTSKIENIVVHKEDEVVESFLKDIFSNFSN